jgi:Peptidase M1 N-terminal domain
MSHPKKEQKHQSGRALADYLLPDDVLPEAYSLRLVPYFQDAPTPAQQFTVDGHVSVTVNARRTTSRIVMHALFLQIHSVNVTQVNISVTF